VKLIDFFGATIGFTLLLIGGYLIAPMANGPATFGMLFLVILMG